ncbi:hypothetical protein JOC78_000748 [Bacillus ectoiniformans]|nr:hypothetical protein [Bacillus ectoiniformans]
MIHGQYEQEIAIKAGVKTGIVFAYSYIYRN